MHQCMRVSATIGKQCLQNVATHVLDPVEQVVIGVFYSWAAVGSSARCTGTDTTE